MVNDDHEILNNLTTVIGDITARLDKLDGGSKKKSTDDDDEKGPSAINPPHTSGRDIQPPPIGQPATAGVVPTPPHKR